ncbi:MAG TPA: hypothetical protein VLX92_14685 [Kofleriaceae bacterium]|nr:hypothetical protein [Kofleriaceae bacterium]
MRAGLIAIALLAVPRLVHASPQADVAALVQATIDHMGDGPTTLAKGATVIGIRANVFDYDSGKRLSGDSDGNELDLKTHGRLWPMIMDKADPAGSKRTLGKVTVVVDPASHTAWFQAPLEVAPARGAKQTFHVSGVATADAKGTWSLRVFQAGVTLSDRELQHYVVLAPWDMMAWATTKGSQDAAVVDWFRHHSFAKNAASGVVLAGGSAPEELASGPAAVKLAATFDKLANLRAIDITATDTALVATGTALWLNKTERDGELEFGFAVYAVKEGGAWKWRSLQFYADQFPRVGE